MMKFKMAHTNFNVLDLEKSIAFYEKALGLKELRRKEAEDGSFILVFMGDGTTEHQIELTWLRDRKEPYDLSDNEIHLAFVVDDFEAAYQHHKRWVAFAMKIRRWGFTSLRTLTDTG